MAAPTIATLLVVITILTTRTTTCCLALAMWRLRCKQDFELQEVPDDWCKSGKNKKRLDALSQANEETWRRYHDYRSRIAKEHVLKEEDEAEMSVENDDDGGNARVLRRMQHALEMEAHDVDFEPWLQHTFQSIDNLQWESYSQNTIRSITTCVTVFSPFLLPHAVELQHTYHYRPRSSWCEFYCNWHFSLLRFDGKPNGDVTQQALAQRYPKDVILLNPTYVADEDMEVLCSNGYLDPPKTVEEIDWIPIQNVDVHNFTPHTVLRIREWLFGSDKSTQVLSDYDFLRLLFASFGTAKFQPLLQGNIGYVWSPNEDDDDDIDSTISLNWLEYQARLVVGALRPQDKRYIPYDVEEAKAEWGRKVLQACPPGTYDIDDNEDLSQTPWLVWERAEKRSLTQKMAMDVMTRLAYGQQQS